MEPAKDLSSYDALGPGDRVVLIRDVLGIAAGTEATICPGEDPVHVSVHGVLAMVVIDGETTPRVLNDADFVPKLG